MPLQQVAETILEQLGGYTFVCMTGARQMVDLGNGISIMFPKNFSPNCDMLIDLFEDTTGLVAHL